jgi:hypothetical protein
LVGYRHARFCITLRIGHGLIEDYLARLASRYATRGVVVSAGSFDPHSGQFDHPCSTARPQLGQVGFIAVPQ